MVTTISNGNLSAVIDPEDGMVVLSLKYRGEEIIYLDEKRHSERLKTYGIPILFPTPNRTRNEEYTFDGKTYKATSHGFAKHQEFTVIEKGEDYIIGDFVTNENTPYFPFIARFIAKLSIQNDTLHYAITLENLDTKRFGYGLALHPFFRKSANATLQCNVRKQMINSEDKLPTGECIIPSGDYDFNVAKDANQVLADTVFLCDGAMKCNYRTDNYALAISCSDEMNHVVIYGNPTFNFICMEPQSCSTDVFNMTNKGFKEEANLLILEPGCKKESTIDFAFTRN